MDSVPKAGQKREITCNYWTTFVKVLFSLWQLLVIFLNFCMEFEGHNYIKGCKVTDAYH